jgi:Ca-activated chloride channel family protein
MQCTLGPAFITLALLGAVALQPAGVVAATASLVAPESDGRLSGVVLNLRRKPIAGALVRLTCDTATTLRETTTDDRGRYAFGSVPAGKCTVQVLTGVADESKVVRIETRAPSRVDFRLDPSSEFTRKIRVEAKPIEQATTVGRTVSMEEFRNIPIGNSTGRDFTQVVGSSTIPLLEATEPFDREAYAHIDDNPFTSPLDRPLSTFAADVDTASYSNVRRFITQGQLPPPDAVRVEELINYFDYEYVAPRNDKPVSVNWEIATCPWNEEHLLARIGLQTQSIADEKVPARNLVFLVDVSGSMNSPDKLPLLQRALQLLVDNLRSEDQVSVVVYAGAAGMVLPPTSGQDLPTIRNAIASLEPGGSTNGAAGIVLAYELARKAFVRKGINRVILATDGDFNVGTTSEGELVRLIEEQRKTGVFLSVLGFGQGNLQDSTMEQLADHGNGNYAYIDDLAEARKVLVEQAGATLVTVAKDVKLQVEFNPAKVAGYRLVGYENRLLADADFDDDTKDAGDMGAGHSVTALYELVPVGTKSAKTPPGAIALRYQQPRTRAAAPRDEWMTVAVRYKAPTSGKSKRFEVPMAGRPNSLRSASDDLRFAAAVAAYGMELRGSEHRGRTSLRMVRSLADGALGRDERGHRAAFIELVDATARIDGPRGAQASASSSHR